MSQKVLSTKKKTSRAKIDLLDDAPSSELYKFPTMGQISKILHSVKPIEEPKILNKVISEKSIGSDVDVPVVIHTKENDS